MAERDASLSGLRVRASHDAWRLVERVRRLAPSISFGVRWFSRASFLRGSPMMALLVTTTARDPSVEALLDAHRGSVGGIYG